MIRWAIDLLLGLLARWRGKADEAHMEARVADARREAVQDRAEADQAAQAVDDPMARLKRDWRHPGATMALFLALAVPGCAPEAQTHIRTVDTACDWTRPILINDMDQFSPATARDVLAHNETWRKRCGKS